MERERSIAMNVIDSVFAVWGSAFFLKEKKPKMEGVEHSI
jgi:hypothetical protein